jgi:hypothetical protein
VHEATYGPLGVPAALWQRCEARPKCAQTKAAGALRVTAEGSAAVAMDELNPFTPISGRWRPA